ncbi:hypothetical protein L6270_02100 [Candidatus Parcubacteria bacterium]|nr:hypothetical protein [Patescibacteria group bacterium]MBU4309448.1 hypothetical protein [Patescibacteria group bacterium]MBU4577809.1 hypothetical protein [Patescibacteria group bacterium]MCG2696802.1 hypothetical protein [Candidatus Parcubacteria bacterium]
MKSKILYFNLAIFIIVAASVFAAGFLLIKSTLPTSAADTDTTTIDDKVPPVISNIKIENTTATSTEISWETDENADSMINFGLDKRYGVEREPRADKIKHTILLEDLLPGQNYYFRAISTDAVGNQGISNDFSFLTTGESNNNVSLDSKTGYAAKILETGFGGLREKILELGKGGLSAVEKEQLLNMVDELAKEVSLDKGYKDSRIGDQAENITNQIVENIGQITSEGDLKEIDQAVKQRAAEISKPPEIILDNATVEVGIDYAIISWATDREANSMVSIAKEGDYEPDAEDPYVWKEGEPTEYVLGHQITITGLIPSMVYHFQVSSADEMGMTGKSSDKSFKTKSVAPEIYNVHTSKIEEESATIGFMTNVPCSAIIEYKNLNTNETKMEGNSSFLTVHSVHLKNLTFDTYYSVIVRVESESGEKAVSAPITFITIKDEYAPVITKVNTESTLYPGSENKVQTIANWWTDEPAKCQLFYHQGLISADEPSALPIEDGYNLKHVEVMTNFLPASVYKYWIICEDSARNKKKSDDFTMLTPSQEESIIDIIIKNFEQQFSWLKKK